MVFYNLHVIYIYLTCNLTMTCKMLSKLKMKLNLNYFRYAIWALFICSQILLSYCEFMWRTESTFKPSFGHCRKVDILQSFQLWNFCPQEQLKRVGLKNATHTFGINWIKFVSSVCVLRKLAGVGSALKTVL
jgi:hypothetical protein